jgi:hypothetical protein
MCRRCSGRFLTSPGTGRGGVSRAVLPVTLRTIGGLYGGTSPLCLGACEEYGVRNMHRTGL